MSAIFSLLPGIGCVLPPESADPLGLPVLAVGAAAASITQTSLQTGQWTPALGDFLVAFTFTRSSTNWEHLSLAESGFGVSGGMVKRAFRRAEATATISVSSWTGIVSASALGRLTLNTDGNTFQQAIVVLVVPGGLQFHRGAAGHNASGTTVTAEWTGGAPNAAALSIGAVAQNGTGGTGLALAGHTAVSGASSEISSLKWGIFAKLGNAPSPLAFSGLQNNNIRGAVGAAIL